MSSELYNKIVSERGGLESLVARIPGFKGYHEKEARRQADTLLRDHLAGELERVVRRFISIENKILDGGKGLKYMSRTRELKSKLQAYVDRVRTAAPKYSGMWAQIKITDEDLDRIYAFDEAQYRYVQRFEALLDALEEAVKSPGEDGFDAQLETVFEVAEEANEAFALRDDVILDLSKSLGGS